MPLMKAVQVSKPGGPFEVVERPIPDPGRTQVRIKVEACGVCHSDVLVKDGMSGLQYPRIPGHEIAGRVDAIGADVTNWKIGQRVGVGWHGGHCFVCDACRRGDFIICQNEKITALAFDGGYAEYVVAPAEAVAAIPDDLSSPDAAPLMCAGVTTYNSLRNSPARAGDLIAIQGIGGLGHLGIQFARQMGFRTVALGRGAGVEALAKKLGAHYYIDTTAGSPAEALQKLGGVRLVMSTAPDAKSVPVLIDGLAKGGELLLLGVPPEPFSVSAAAIVVLRRNIQGWPSGTAKDSEDTLQFCSMTGVRAMIEKFPLEKAAEAYDHMLSGRVQFRAVLTM
jgi:D-arabinose 1-dehydrogenase-like Zn-dependent alcohol dehydrogenase